jgi:hypothetical protein
MLRLYRQWRLIRRLHAALDRPEPGDGFVVVGKKMRVVKGRFAQDTADQFPGKKFWGESNKINSLLDACIEDKYLDSARRESDGKILITLSPSKGEEFCSFWNFLQTLFTKYDKILVPSAVLAAIMFVGGFLVHSLWPSIIQPAWNRWHGGATSISEAGAKEPEKPPTLFDLFQTDNSNTHRLHDTNWTPYQLKASDGSTIDVLPQLYFDFPARAKFVGFYIKRPVPPSSGFGAEKTLGACLKLLEGNAIRQSFDNLPVGAAAGPIGQMTDAKDLVFSGRVLIYHEEDLSIPQKATIIAAYKKESMEVQFFGTDHLSTALFAWHQQHDAKK